LGIAPKLLLSESAHRDINPSCVASQWVSIIVSENDHLSGRQIAAARTLLGLGQAELAAAAKISVPTLRRMESSLGAANGYFNNLAAVRRALEAAGVEFTNGGQPGVRMRATRKESET
jgi:DNA-binding transcriptional regulator YiaG